METFDLGYFTQLDDSGNPSDRYIVHDDTCGFLSPDEKYLILFLNVEPAYYTGRSYRFKFDLSKARLVVNKYLSLVKVTGGTLALTMVNKNEMICGFDPNVGTRPVAASAFLVFELTIA